MRRSIGLVALLAVVSSARAEEVELKRASVGATAMKGVRRIDVEAGDLENLVVRPWARPDAQFVARKVAADAAALDVLRVEVTVVGDRMSIRLGERVRGAWTPLRAGSRIDLVVDVPARLMGLPAKQPVEPSGGEPTAASAADPRRPRSKTS